MLRRWKERAQRWIAHQLDLLEAELGTTSSSGPPIVPAPAPPEGCRLRSITIEEYHELAKLWATGKLAKPPRPPWIPEEPEPDAHLGWCPRCHRAIEALTKDEAERIREGAKEWPWG